MVDTLNYKLCGLLTRMFWLPYLSSVAHAPVILNGGWGGGRAGDPQHPIPGLQCALHDAYPYAFFIGSWKRNDYTITKKT